METHINLNGVQIKIKQVVTDSGKPTIVFLHDSLGCITLWRDFPVKLGAAVNCNIFVYDRQGYGESDPFTDEKRDNQYLEVEAEVLNILLEKLKLANVILFGHSDGGSIALIAAAKYPERISGVITEGAHIFVEEITLQGIKDAMKTYENTNLKEKLEKYHGKKTEGVFAAWTNTWLTDEFRAWNIEKFLPQIKCPVLVIQGEKDEFGSLEQVHGIMNQVSGFSHKLIVPDAGHTPHKEAPAAVIKAAAEAINRITSHNN